MEIEIIGSRSSSACWLAAQDIPLDRLPPLTFDGRVEVENTGFAEEDLARLRYAVSLTDIELAEKLRKIAKPMSRWMTDHQVAGKIRRATLNTLEGKLRFELDTPSGIVIVEMEEKLADDILIRGSKDAFDSFARLLAFNLGDVKLAAAS